MTYLEDEDGKEMRPPHDVEACEDGVTPAVPVLGHLQPSDADQGLKTVPEAGVRDGDGARVGELAVKHARPVREGHSRGHDGAGTLTSLHPETR